VEVAGFATSIAQPRTESVTLSAVRISFASSRLPIGGSTPFASSDLHPMDVLLKLPIAYTQTW
jgi:hypothetical protein